MKGRNSDFVVALFVLLLTADKPWLSSARSTFLESILGSLARRDLHSKQHEPQGVALEMMHIHHIDSPYAPPNLTLAERMKSAAMRSKARAQFLHAQISGELYSTKQQTTDALSLPLYYGGLVQGEYDINLGLGTPSRTIRATADTGSDLFWLQCEPCTSCLREPDPLFNPQNSSSYETLSCSTDDDCPSSAAATCSNDETCMFSYGYADGSLDQGDLASETVTLNDVNGTPMSFPNISFGCANFANGSQVGDGLVGLGPGNVSLVQQLGPQIGYIFSYCLVDFVSASNRTSTLLLGSAGDVPLNYTPIVLFQGYLYTYYVNVTDIKVDGKSIDYPADTFAIVENGDYLRGGMIVDSGTPITQMDARAYNPLLDSLESLISYPVVNVSESDDFELDYCVSVTNVSKPTFPTLSFHFQGGVDIVLPDDNLFQELQVEDNVYCLQISSVPEGSLSIFGNIQQQNFQIAFDIGENRIGFAPKTC